MISISRGVIGIQGLSHLSRKHHCVVCLYSLTRILDKREWGGGGGQRERVKRRKRKG